MYDATIRIQQDEKPRAISHFSAESAFLAEQGALKSVMQKIKKVRGKSTVYYDIIINDEFGKFVKQLEDVCTVRDGIIKS